MRLINALLHSLPDLEDAACYTYPRHEAIIWDGKNEDDERTTDQITEDTRRAKHICRQECPVTQACLEWAIKQDISLGIWGGMNYDERKALVRRMVPQPRHA